MGSRKDRMKRRGARRDWMKVCQYCKNCISIGDGDFVCGADFEKIVISDDLPTDSYRWCGGEHFQN